MAVARFPRVVDMLPGPLRATPPKVEGTPLFTLRVRSHSRYTPEVNRWADRVVPSRSRILLGNVSP